LIIRESAHRLPELADSGHGDLAALPGEEPVAAPGDFQVGREPVDVPFSGAGQRLVEVVDVEHQGGARRAEQAEVGQVRILARRRREPRHGVAARSLAC